MKLHVLLPVHNRRSITEKFVLSLIRQTYKDFSLILLDDGSEDETAELVKSLIPQATVIRGDGKWWWAGALQVGFDHLLRKETSSADAVLLINDDTLLPDHFLETGLSLLNASTKKLILARAMSLQTGEPLGSAVRVNWKRLTFSPEFDSNLIDCGSTNGLLGRWGDFLKIGGFHPKWLPHYLSDYEYTIRACRKGYQIVSDSTWTLFWNEATTGISKVQASSFTDYLRQLFSNRSKENPLHLFFFIIFACPWYCLPWNLARCFKVFLTGIGRGISFSKMRKA